MSSCSIVESHGSASSLSSTRVRMDRAPGCDAYGLKLCSRSSTRVRRGGASLSPLTTSGQYFTILRSGLAPIERPYIRANSASSSQHQELCKNENGRALSPHSNTSETLCTFTCKISSTCCMIRESPYVEGGDVMVKSNVNRGRERREQLRARAQQLTEERSNRSPSQQLELLDTRLGVGVGAVKERAQLQREIDDKRSTKSRQKSRPPPSNKKGERRKAKSRRNAEREKKQRKST